MSDNKPAAPDAVMKPEASAARKPPVTQPPGEIGGPAGPEPTRFGDWEFKGRCSDF